MLEAEPFSEWPVERSLEDGLPRRVVQYVFPKNGLELRCDEKEKISSIFLYSEEYGGFDESLLDFPFSFRRSQVVDRLGLPSKSGSRLSDPILGEYGAWDRFSRADHVVHAEYRLDADSIKQITLMRADIAP